MISVQFCRGKSGCSGGGDGGDILERTSLKYGKVALLGVFLSGQNPKIIGAYKASLKISQSIADLARLLLICVVLPPCHEWNAQLSLSGFPGPCCSRLPQLRDLA